MKQKVPNLVGGMEPRRIVALEGIGTVAAKQFLPSEAKVKLWNVMEPLHLFMQG